VASGNRKWTHGQEIERGRKKGENERKREGDRYKKQ
jgi:hypothetical protein